MKKKRVIFMFTVLVAFCSFVSGCGKPTIYSKRFDHEINIDEKINELKDILVYYYYDENTRVNIGVGNDDTYLYLCLLTRNHGLIEQLDNSGFTVWFDPKGGKTKNFGIRLFTGIQDDNVQQGGILLDKNNPAKSAVTASVAKKIEITGPGKKERYTTTIETAKKYGITVKTGDLDGYFVYELKVPLVESEQHHYAIGVGKNKIISVGLESSGFGRGMPHGMGPDGGGMSDISAGMMKFGGMGGFGGGGPGGGGPGGGGGGRGGMPEGDMGLEFWLTLVLS